MTQILECKTHREVGRVLKAHYGKVAPNDTFMYTWLSKAEEYKLDDVKFVAIKMMEQKYFPEWGKWAEMLEGSKKKEHIKEQLEERNKPRPLQNVNERSVFREHLDKWLNQEYTFYQYMTEGLKNGFFTNSEYNKEIERRKKLNKNGFDYCKRSGLV